MFDNFRKKYAWLNDSNHNWDNYFLIQASDRCLEVTRHTTPRWIAYLLDIPAAKLRTPVKVVFAGMLLGFVFQASIVYKGDHQYSGLAHSEVQTQKLAPVTWLTEGMMSDSTTLLRYTHR